MSEPYVMAGFAAIAVLYAVIGLLAAAGSVALSQRLFTAGSEQVFFGVLLAVIAGFYLAFVAYFGDVSSWSTELLAVGVFSLLGIAGARYAAVLVPGYFLHGIWDALHEIGAHGGLPAFGPAQLTEIPLAYGVFCLAYDVAIAVYFFRRKGSWERALPPRAGASTAP